MTDDSGIVKLFALDLRNAFPNVKDFSDTNVKYVKRRLLFYYEQVIKGQHVGGHWKNAIGQQPVVQSLMGKKVNKLLTFLEIPDLFGNITWGCSIEI